MKVRCYPLNSTHQQCLEYTELFVFYKSETVSYFTDGFINKRGNICFERLETKSVSSLSVTREQNTVHKTIRDPYITTFTVKEG